MHTASRYRLHSHSHHRARSAGVPGAVRLPKAHVVIGARRAGVWSEPAPKDAREPAAGAGRPRLLLQPCLKEGSTDLYADLDAIHPV